jgi:dolichyl-phosphate beta-glucosyltransferase
MPYTENRSDVFTTASVVTPSSGRIAQRSELPLRSLAISIIVPAFNEERRLPKTLELIHSYLAMRQERAEVIVVVDGSSDGTARLVEEARRQYPELRVISNGCNRGKGYSVRRGVLEARGEIILVTDADLSAPIEEADKLLAGIREHKCDGAIGSRMIRSIIKVRQSAFRQLAGVIFNCLVRWITGINFADTQCGFKAFHREHVRVVFEQQRIEGFGFDPEILFLATVMG